MSRRFARQASILSPRGLGERCFVKRILGGNQRWHILALLPFACAKVTTNYPAFDAGPADSAGGSGTGGASSSGGFSSSTSSGGGATSSGGNRATGGLAAVATGGVRAATGGTASATGGAPSAPTGGTKAATGGTPGSGGAPGTGGAFTGDAGSGCASGALFCDDFEAYATAGPAGQWTAGSGTWSVVTDASEPAGDQKAYSNTGTSNASAKITSGTYTNASIEARIRVTSFSSTSASNSAGVFIRSNGSNDYDLSLGGDGKIYLRRDPTSSTEESCTSGTSNGASGIAMQTCSGKACTGWFRLKLSVMGTVAAGIVITGYVDATASGTFTQVLQCTQSTGASYMIDSGSAGAFAKGSAPAFYDDVIVNGL
jgi:hypothetical protein